MAIDLPVIGQQNWGEPLNVALRDMDVTRPGSLAEAELSSRLSAAAGSAEGMVQAAITASRPILYGTGFPNGKVAAPVGTLYSDEAVTNGASLWQKITGTGNTGWVVVRGDTGWRTLTNPGEGVIYLGICRDGRDVGINFRVRTTGIIDVTFNVPTGFRFRTQSRDAMWTFDYGGPGKLVVQTGAGGDTLRLFTTGVFDLSAYIQYMSSDQWPASLPGTN